MNLFYFGFMYYYFQCYFSTTKHTLYIFTTIDAIEKFDLLMIIKF